MGVGREVRTPELHPQELPWYLLVHCLLQASIHSLVEEVTASAVLLYNLLGCKVKVKILYYIWGAECCRSQRKQPNKCKHSSGIVRAVAKRTGTWRYMINWLIYWFLASLIGCYNPACGHKGRTNSWKDRTLNIYFVKYCNYSTTR